MDGNGRWAQNKGLLRVEGHRAGMETAKTIVRCCLRAEVPILSLFAFSSENWSRPEDEVGFLMQIFMDALEKEVDELHQNGVRLIFTGDKASLSKTLCTQMLAAEQMTKNNMRLTLNIVINYGGKWDIVQAIKTIVNQVNTSGLPIDAIDETMVTQALSMHPLPDPDLLIRTSGEKRISNFFLWQLAYTELYFTEVYWPDFTEEQFQKALECYRFRERRYGKTSQQLSEVAQNV